VSDAELERLRTEYRRRDAAGGGPYRWDNPGYVSYMQGLERAVLHGLSDAGVNLSGARVLDIGCGSGYFLHRLHEYGAGDCHGIDLLDERIAEARERYPSLDFHVGSATQVPFEDGAFEVVTQFTCLSSIIDNDVRLAAAREMRRVAGQWVLSIDMHRSGTAARATQTVGLDLPELRRLFGKPVLVRSIAPSFDVAQLLGRHDLLARLVGALPPMRSHYLGIWQASG
jgi:2-polyprenyl-3-methyl-5-hydroxy-6-metoxy-1,4-benzoquinol methylase